MTVSYNVLGLKGWQFEPIPIDFSPIWSVGQATIRARFENDAGETITDPQQGDEAWVVVSIEDGRGHTGGIYKAHFDVEFDSGNIEVIGNPESQGDFTSGLIYTRTDRGFTDLGAFGDNNSDGQFFTGCCSIPYPRYR